MFLMALSDLATGRTAVGMISRQGFDQPGLLEHANRTPRREVYLIDPDGQVIYHQDKGRDRPGLQHTCRCNTGIKR